MTCRECLDFILGYLEGDLPADERETFERHLANCPPCECYLRQYKTTVAAAKAAFTAPEAGLPADVPEELIAAILKSRRD